MIAGTLTYDTPEKREYFLCLVIGVFVRIEYKSEK